MSKAEAIKCCVCGCTEDRKYSSDIMAEMVRVKLCYTCFYWACRATLYRDQAASEHRTMAVLNGSLFMLAPNVSPQTVRRTGGLMIGFGGQPHVVEFLDGTKQLCNNVVSNGEIPEPWLAQFPNNTKAITRQRHSMTAVS